LRAQLVRASTTRPATQLCSLSVKRALPGTARIARVVAYVTGLERERMMKPPGCWTPRREDAGATRFCMAPPGW
jgi:hypothetical protein